MNRVVLMSCFSGCSQSGEGWGDTWKIEVDGESAGESGDGGPEGGVASPSGNLGITQRGRWGGEGAAQGEAPVSLARLEVPCI